MSKPSEELGPSDVEAMQFLQAIRAAHRSSASTVTSDVLSQIVMNDVLGFLRIAEEEGARIDQHVAATLSNVYDHAFNVGREYEAMQRRR